MAERSARRRPPARLLREPCPRCPASGAPRLTIRHRKHGSNPHPQLNPRPSSVPEEGRRQPDSPKPAALPQSGRARHHFGAPRIVSGCSNEQQAYKTCCPA
jgi:hypothetical protein